MRKRLIIGFVLLAVAAVALAADQESIEQLKARAEAAKPSDQVKLFLALAERQMKTAEDSYSHGDADKGRAAVQDVADYCDRAGSAARTSGKHLKNTEIRMRDIERKLDNLSRSVDFDDREPVKAAMKRLEKIRADLLTTMFGLKS